MSALWSLFRRTRKNAWESACTGKRAKALAWAVCHYADPQLQTVAARFVVILEAQISVPLEQFTLSTRLLEDLGMDDLEPVEVVMAMEEEFPPLYIPELDAERLCTVDELIRYIANAIREKTV